MKNLKKLYEYCLSRDIPAISPATQDFLEQKLLGQTPRWCLEIGSASGYSTAFFAQTIQARGGHLLSCEISYHQYLYASSHLKKQRNTMLYPYALTTDILPKIVHGKLDFVFIDCAKKFYGQYLEMILKYVADTNTIILDDVIKFKHKLGSLYESLDKHTIPYTIIQLDDDDGIMIIQNAKRLS